MAVLPLSLQIPCKSDPIARRFAVRGAITPRPRGTLAQSSTLAVPPFPVAGGARVMTPRQERGADNSLLPAEGAGPMGEYGAGWYRVFGRQFALLSAPIYPSFPAPRGRGTWGQRTPTR